MSSEKKEPVTSSADSYATNKTFADLGVQAELVAVLEKQGITTAFPIQAMTIADALDGRDICGKAKTGSGKTLGFGLPMLQRIAASAEICSEATDPHDRADWSYCLPENSPCKSTRSSSRSARRWDLHVNAVYGGADIERQVKSLRQGQRHHHRDARATHRPR